MCDKLLAVTGQFSCLVGKTENLLTTYTACTSSRDTHTQKILLDKICIIPKKVCIHNMHRGFHWYLVQNSIIIDTVKWIHGRYVGFQTTQSRDTLEAAIKKWGDET